jgi:oligoribonuclease NrnB/cAMP/cGMP phosphodiesterase (DHH superfamily)
MKIYHHIDNDGYCAAAIAKNYLVNAFDIATEYD